jgi:hypothetical protein
MSCILKELAGCCVTVVSAVLEWGILSSSPCTIVGMQSVLVAIMALMVYNVDPLAARSDQDHLNKIEQTKLVAGDFLKCKSCNVDAQTEIESKAYSDTELATNNATRENMQSDVDELAATVRKHVAESTQLGEELAFLTEALGSLRQEQSEATKIRSEEKATNEQTVAVAKIAQVAVERATQVLKDFYSKAAAGQIALVQGGLAQAMHQASKEPYTGMQSENGGIIGLRCGSG